MFREVKPLMNLVGKTNHEHLKSPQTLVNLLMTNNLKRVAGGRYQVGSGR